MDQISLERIHTLHPSVRSKFLAFYTDLCNMYKVQGWRVIQAFRTFEEQNALYEQGRTKPGAIVTYCKGGASYHNFGLAIDVLPMSVDFKAIATVSDRLWVDVGALGKKHGLNWGGKFQKPDRPHFEIHPHGNKIPVLLKWYKQGLFISGTKYLDIPPF